MVAEKEYKVLRTFLLDMIYNYPESLYNAYYFLLLGMLYEREGSTDIANIYYNRVVNNYDNLVTSSNESTHIYSLDKLIKFHQKDPLRRIRYYNMLLNNFSGEIDRGQTHYYLAKAYEEEGLWEESLMNYRRFLLYPDSQIPGEPNAHSKVNQYLTFHKASKSWTQESLDSLVNSIKYAINAKDSYRLERYKGSDFFIMGWGKGRYDPYSKIPMTLGSYMRSPIWYDTEIIRESTDQEAYLRTGGWEYRINNWYFYFSRVYYPINPEIHNRWEWKGIYLGNKI